MVQEKEPWSICVAWTWAESTCRSEEWEVKEQRRSWRACVGLWFNARPKSSTGFNTLLSLRDEANKSFSHITLDLTAEFARSDLGLLGDA